MWIVEAARVTAEFEIPAGGIQCIFNDREFEPACDLGVTAGVFEHLRRDFPCYLASQRSLAAPFRDTTARTNYPGTALCIRFRMRTKL